MLSKLFKYSLFDYCQFMFFLYHKVNTKFWFGIFFSKMGKGCCIINPILLTPSCICFGNNVFIRNGARIEGIYKYEGVTFKPVIDLHGNVSVEQNIHITCANRISIGKNTAIASNVTITDIVHPYEDILLPPERQLLTVKFVQIGEDCKIYNNAVILPGTKIGKHSVVAANSVVLGRTYPDYSILAGSPARIIKRYNFELESWAKTDMNGKFI